MVHDRLWPADVSDGFLCIGCLEERIGRRLRPRDFTRAFINRSDNPCHTDRLRSRLTPRPKVQTGDFSPENSEVISDACHQEKTAKPLGSPRLSSRGLRATEVPPELMERILRAEIGERGVIRNLCDQPPPKLLAELKRSTGNFARRKV